MPGPEFLDLQARTVKPRGTGITHVLDRGLPLEQCGGLLDAGGAFVDVWKFGWGISYVDPNLAAKLELLAQHRVLASPGGTLLEIAWAQGRAAAFFDWARACGFPCVEVSAGTVPMSAGDKRDLIAEAARHFIVLAEVGPRIRPRGCCRSSGRRPLPTISTPARRGCSPRAGPAARSASTGRPARCTPTSSTPWWRWQTPA